MLHDDNNPSDRQSSSEPARDEVAEQAFGRLADAWDPQAQAVADGRDRAVRDQLEAVALLAYGLEPETPSAGAEGRLLDAVSRAAARPRSVAGAAAAPLVGALDRAVPDRAVPDRDLLDRTLQHAAPTDGRSTDVSAADNLVPFTPRAAEPRGGSALVLALAAGLALCLVGLGYLYGQLNAKNAELFVQAERLRQLPELEATVDRMRAQLRTTRDRLAMVDTVARQAYPLRQVSAGPARARGQELVGRVYVCGHHQKWYLTVSGLEPAPAGQEYHLWFLTGDGPVDAGVVDVEDGAATLRDLTMPEGTGGFSLTLEPRDLGDQPRGRVILAGDSPVKL